MSERACVFHFPFPVEQGSTSGSQIRPAKMLAAFQSLGLEVESVTGYAAERRTKARKVLHDVKAGRTFDFVYSESQTIPTLLTEPNHLPISPAIDFGFFRELRKHGVPIGLFYRDIYWRFEQYVHTPLKQRLVSLPFYHYDWWQYRRLVDVLFLPSLEMAAHLPSVWAGNRLAALPPGVPSGIKRTKAGKSPHGKLELFYVGGVNPPIYDLTPAFEMLEKTPRAHLVLCCREREWRTWQHHYRVPENVTVVHVSGTALAEYYAAADAFVLVRQPNPYLDFAMPVKIFEALGYTLPIITTGDSSGGKFIQSNGVGWTVNMPNDFKKLVDELIQNPDLLRRKQDHVAAQAQQHTWQARASYVEQVMATYKEKATTKVNEAAMRKYP